MFKDETIFLRDERNRTGVRVVYNSAFLMLSSMLTKLISFLTIIFIARYLSIADFGKYSFVVAFIGFFSLITGLGLSPLIVREIARDRIAVGRYFGNGLMLTSLSFLFSLILVVVISRIINLPKYILSVALIFGLALFPEAIQSLFSSLFIGLEQMGKSTIIVFLASAVRLALIVAALLSKRGLIGLALACLLSSIVTLIFNYFVLVKDALKARTEIDFSFAWAMLKEATPFMIYGFLFLIYFKIDVLMLSFMKGDEAVGQYGLSYRLVDSLIVIPAALMGALLPTFSRFSKASINDVRIAYQRASKYLSLIGIPLALGTTLLAPQIIPLFYGISYQTSVATLQILIWGVALIFINCICQIGLNATNRQTINVLTMFIGLVVNVGLNFILIPSFSLIGASIATVLTEIVVTMLSFYFFFRYVCKLPIMKTSYKPILASCVMGLVIFRFDELTVFLLIPLAILAYFICILGLNFFDRSDIELFLRIFRLNKKVVAY